MLGRQGILHHLCQSMLGGFCFALISCPSHRRGKHPGVGHRMHPFPPLPLTPRAALNTLDTALKEAGQAIMA
jgi:hypothetical protein